VPAPVVLIHGLSGSADWWRRVTARFDPGREVHPVDLPKRLSLEDAAEWLAQRLRADKLERVDLVGHSTGGLICARLAADRPAHVVAGDRRGARGRHSLAPR
jgi:pimeloyl-ACP methyl ester carboxylesterase